MTTYYKAVIYKDKTHQPLGVGDRLSFDSIPVSQVQPNGIRVLPDGLCVGGSTIGTYYVDGVNGIDDPSSGRRPTPFKTLDYALSQIIATYDLNYVGNGVTILGNVVVALKCGQTYTMARSWQVTGTVQIAFWGDPQYGDFDAPFIGSPGARNWVASDLQRPIIAPTIDPSTANGVQHFQLSQGGTLQMMGVQIDLPAGSQQNSDYCSFCNTSYSETGTLRMNGVIANKLDVNSSYGLFGIHSRSKAKLEAFACQMRVGGKLIQQVPGNPAPTAAELLARKWMLVFYPDLLGSQQSGGFLTGGNPATGLLDLMWSVIPSQTITGTSATSLDTFPVYSDPAFGIANYFFNLSRDGQSRPLNVVTPILF